jgi:hypothetical protein
VKVIYGEEVGRQSGPEEPRGERMLPSRSDDAEASVHAANRRPGSPGASVGDLGGAVLCGSIHPAVRSLSDKSNS